MNKSDGGLPVEQVVKHRVGEEVLVGQHRHQVWGSYVGQRTGLRRADVCQRDSVQYTSQYLHTEPLHTQALPLIRENPLVVVGEHIPQHKLHSCQSWPTLKHFRQLEQKVNFFTNSLVPIYLYFLQIVWFQFIYKKSITV